MWYKKYIPFSKSCIVGNKDEFWYYIYIIHNVVHFCILEFYAYLQRIILVFQLSLFTQCMNEVSGIKIWSAAGWLI